MLLVYSPHDALAPVTPSEPKAAEAWIDRLFPAIAMESIWRMPKDNPLTLGFCGVPYATGIKRLYLASRQVLPALGLEGELLAGLNAAKLVLASDKKRDLVKGEVLLGS